MEIIIGDTVTDNTNQAIAINSPSPSTEAEPQMTERSNEPPDNGNVDIEWPQEMLDLVWNKAMEPWLKKRVIVLDCFHWTKETRDSFLSKLLFSLECANPIDVEMGELVGNIRLVDRRAKSTVSLSLSKAARVTFPESPDLTRKGLGESFRAQHADFQHDVFWLSRSFIEARFEYLWYEKDDRVHPDALSQERPQPSHMMLNLRHMLAIMQMAYLRDTPCIRSRSDPWLGYGDPLRDFHRVVSVGSTHSGADRLRILTVLLPQNLDELNGKVNYEDLEHRPFGTSVEEKAAVFELARTQARQDQLEEIYIHWADLMTLAEGRGLDLPLLQFSRSRL